VIKPVNHGLALSRKPGKDKRDAPLKSVAITGAPVSVSTPEQWGVEPFTLMSRPHPLYLRNMHKPVLKIFSVIKLVPSDTAINAINCACISVGNPGYGIVFISTLKGLCGRLQHIPFLPPE